MLRGLIILVVLILSGCVFQDTTEKPIDEPIEELLDQNIEKIPEFVESDTEVVVVDDKFEEVKPKLVGGKTLDERLDYAYDNLHEPNSATQIEKDFPDLELVYVDKGTSFMPSLILPFKYYYSMEADTTFNLCNIDRSVFICEGKLDRIITQEDIDSGRCVVTSIYKIGDYGP
jgi:hypothetical protein